MTSLSNLSTETCKVVATGKRYQGSYNVTVEFPNGWRYTYRIGASTQSVAKMGAIQQGNHDYRVSYDRLSYVADRG